MPNYRVDTTNFNLSSAGDFLSCHIVQRLSELDIAADRRFREYVLNFKGHDKNHGNP